MEARFLHPLDQAQPSDSPSDGPAMSYPVPIPLPLSPTPPPTTSLAVVIDNDKAVMSLIEQLLHRAGVTQTEIARRMGISPSTLNQYRWLRRKRPSIQWMARLASACGARLYIEFPSKPLR